MAFEYLVEGRGQGSTVVRLVHSGFLGGTTGRRSTTRCARATRCTCARWRSTSRTSPAGSRRPSARWPPQQPDQERCAGRGCKRGLGLTGAVSEGDGSGSPSTVPPIEGVVDSVLFPSFLGVRTDDGLYRFVGGERHGLRRTPHLRDDVDQEEAEAAWQSWLTRLFA